MDPCRGDGGLALFFVVLCFNGDGYAASYAKVSKNMAPAGADGIYQVVEDHVGLHARRIRLCYGRSGSRVYEILIQLFSYREHS